ncbi:hypothetical protein GQ600_10004 [Phytophthora cactorum]|nr:hypothetical protein GQ600_10004 [Phytophthora cactorum]
MEKIENKPPGETGGRHLYAALWRFNRRKPGAFLDKPDYSVEP